MSRLFRSLLPIVPLLALLTASAAGCARHSDEPSEDEISGRVHERVEAALDDIEATSEQRQKIQGLEERLLEQITTFHAGAKTAHEQASELWLAERADPKQAHALVDQRMDALREGAHQVTDIVLELHDVLTPEQRQAIAKRIEERRQHGMHRF